MHRNKISINWPRHKPKNFHFFGLWSSFTILLQLLNGKMENSSSLQVGSWTLSSWAPSISKADWQGIPANFSTTNHSRSKRGSAGHNLHSGPSWFVFGFKTDWKYCPSLLVDASLLQLWWNSLSKIVSCLQRGLLSRISGKGGWGEFDSALFWHNHLVWD